MTIGNVLYLLMCLGMFAAFSAALALHSRPSVRTVTARTRADTAVAPHPALT